MKLEIRQDSPLTAEQRRLLAKLLATGGNFRMGSRARWRVTESTYLTGVRMLCWHKHAGDSGFRPPSQGIPLHDFTLEVIE